MFMDNNQVFSIRKFKNGRVDSKLIGLAGIFSSWLYEYDSGIC